MDSKVKSFLNPKDYDTISQGSNQGSSSKLSLIRKRQKNGGMARSVKSQQFSQADRYSQQSQKRFNEKEIKQFNNYLKDNLKTYQTTYSKDFNKGGNHNRKNQSQLNLQNLNKMDSDEVIKNTGIKKQQKEKLLQLQKQQKRQQQLQEINALNKQNPTNCKGGFDKSKEEEKVGQEQEFMIQSLLKFLEQSDGQIDIDKLIYENKDYIMHVFAKCKCFSCKCGFCQCNYYMNSQLKFRLKKTINSSYNRDFFNKNKQSLDQLNDLPECDQRTYDMNYNEPFHKQIDFQSTQRQDFTQKKAEPVGPYRQPRLGKEDMKTLRSNYNVNFVNFKEDKIYRPNIKAGKSVIDKMPLYSSTSYNKDFMNFYKNQYMSQTFKNTNNSFKCPKMNYEQQPIMPEFKLKEDQYKTMNTFYNSQLGNPSMKIPKRNLKQPYHQMSTTQHDGLYRSTFTRDFKGTENPQCEGNQQPKKKDYEEIRNNIISMLQKH